MTTPKITPYIQVTPHPRFSMRVDVEYVGYTKPYHVRWGDGLIDQGAPGGVPVWHLYDREGAYQLRVHDAETGAFQDQQLVTIRGGRAPKGYEIGRDTVNTSVVEIRFTDTDDGTGVLPKFAVEWPKTKDRITAWGVPGQKLTRALPYGDHTIEITDLTSHRAAKEQVHMAPPDYAPDYTLRRKPGGDNLTVELEVTKTSGDKDIALSWNHGPVEVKATPKVGDKFEHTYPDPGTGQSQRYLVIAAYDDETGLSKTTGITVPLT